MVRHTFFSARGVTSYLGSFAIILAAAFGFRSEAPGALVIVGGGGTPDEAVLEAIKLAGGPKADVLIVPWASQSENRGDSSVEMYEELGAKNASNADDFEGAALKKAIREAELIWMPGGSQTRLIETMKERGVLEEIRNAHQRGCVVGGTSAGAAVMSDPMIARGPSEEGIRQGISSFGEGLGLWPGVFVDQHFIERNRQTRLITAVFEGPHRIGVGIGESTAVVVEGRDLRVLGRSAAQIYDARDAKIEKPLGEGECLAATGVTLHVLRAGMKWRWVE